MRTVLKLVHLLGLATFLGSVFGHILLGNAAAPGTEAFAWAQEAKHASTLALTAPGLLVTLASGAGLAALNPALLRRRWLRLKIGLAALVTLNAFWLLTPLGAEIAAAAAAAAPEVAAPTARESLLGATNLLMVLGILVLAVARPRLDRALAGPASEGQP